MRILLAGGEGQVGAEIARLQWPEETELRVMTSATMDITDKSTVDEIVRSFRPEVIVNCAAFTKVDLAEEEPERAFEVNSQAVRHLSRAADQVGSGLLHLSTDYVFDGTKIGWYTESDRPNPLSVYGASKLDGETNALMASRAVVLRTSWVYGALRTNFVTTMRRLALDGAVLSVVSDQTGCPTSARDIAVAIRSILSQGMSHTGLFHLSAPDDATWFDLAQETLRLSAGVTAEVRPIGTDEYNAKAVRPPNSRLDSARVADAYGITLPSWRDSLADVCNELDRREAT